MTAHGFTAGEWQVHVEDGEVFVYQLNARGTNRFLLQVLRGLDDDNGWISAKEVQEIGYLIAAAPMMLDALKDAEAEIACRDRYSEHVLTKVREAIAAATGSRG